MKAVNIKWKTNDTNIPKEIEIPKGSFRFIFHKDEVRPEYSFLMGYKTGIPQKWWHGIRGITFIFMGAWNDSLVGYKDYAINSHFIEDTMWEKYNEEFSAPDYHSPEYVKFVNDFSKYMRENKEMVFDILDSILEDVRWAIIKYIFDATGKIAVDFDTAA